MLKAPQSLPQPFTRRTICDQSISMHLCGGSDFPVAATSTEPKEKGCEQTSNEKAGMSDVYKKGVAFLKVSSTVNANKQSQKWYAARADVVEGARRLESQFRNMCGNALEQKSIFTRNISATRTWRVTQVLAPSDFEP